MCVRKCVHLCSCTYLLKKLYSGVIIHKFCIHTCIYTYLHIYTYIDYHKGSACLETFEVLQNFAALAPVLPPVRERREKKKEIPALDTDDDEFCWTSACLAACKARSYRKQLDSRRII